MSSLSLHSSLSLGPPACALLTNLQDLFAAMAKPQHLEAVKAVVGVFARDVVCTYLAGPAAAQPPPALTTAAAAAVQQLRWVLGGCAGHSGWLAESSTIHRALAASHMEQAGSNGCNEPHCLLDCACVMLASCCQLKQP